MPRKNNNKKVEKPLDITYSPTQTEAVEKIAKGGSYIQCNHIIGEMVNEEKGTTACKAVVVELIKNNHKHLFPTLVLLDLEAYKTNPDQFELDIEKVRQAIHTLIPGFAKGMPYTIY